MFAHDPSHPAAVPVPGLRDDVSRHEVGAVVRDVTRPPVGPAVGAAVDRAVDWTVTWAGLDTGLGAAFPVTYDVVLHPGQQVRTGEDF